MSGRIDTCQVCGGELRTYPFEYKPYTVLGGYCGNCNHARVAIPQAMEEDENFDTDAICMEVSNAVLDWNRCKLIDSPEFQLLWTTKPDENRLCSSCTHGRRIVENGKDIGQGCDCHPEIRPRFYNILIENCKDYEPRNEWYGMGSECRNCYWSCKAIAEGCMCFDRKMNLRDISDYDKGHCRKYIYSTIWNFECHGYTECPECGKLARMTKNKVVCGFCGYKGERSI